MKSFLCNLLLPESGLITCYNNKAKILKREQLCTVERKRLVELRFFPFRSKFKV